MKVTFITLVKGIKTLPKQFLKYLHRRKTITIFKLSGLFLKHKEIQIITLKNRYKSIQNKKEQLIHLNAAEKILNGSNLLQSINSSPSMFSEIKAIQTSLFQR